MKIENKGDAFVVKYNLKEHEIPSGSMTVNDESLGNFILEKAFTWGFDVQKTEDSVKVAIEPIEAIEVEEKKEEAKEEPKKEEKAKGTKKEDK